MASNSNQNSSCGWEHDVFLSFRGEDVRKSFVSHLHASLKRSGIQTFKDDDELRIGDVISSELRQGIQNSRASIIIFSQHYACSTWCLKELVEILECKSSKDQVVIPVYYNVEPTDLRNLDGTGSYAKALRNHRSHPGLQTWRAALKNAAELKGHVLSNEYNGDEAQFIENIVGEVQKKTVRLVVTEPLIESSRDSNRYFINKILGIGSNDARIIGIYGMEGIGKSVISKAVYNEHVNKFQCSAVVENIKDVSKQAGGILQLQEKLLCQLKQKEIKPDTIDQGTQMIQRICHYNKVLILLDDIDDSDQIIKLAIRKSWLSAGSRVIAVTRNEKLLKEAEVKHTHEMKALNWEESLKLLTKNAIKEDETPTDYQSVLLKNISRLCEGLPTALEVIGRYLRREDDLDFWRYVLKEFQSKHHQKVHDLLKIDFDALNKEYLRQKRQKLIIKLQKILISCETPN